MRARRASLMIAAALSAMPWMAHAQPMEIPAALSEGSVPAAPGTGVQAMFVLGFFRGSPYTLSHARDILAGTSLTPAFDAWCGLLPQVDFTNGTTVDSLGRSAPTTMCLPFQDPLSEQSQPCRPLPGLPSGRYSTNGGAVLRLRGWFAVRSAGTYTFAWGHDDGMAFDVGPVPVFAYHDGTAPRVDRRVLRFEAPGLYPFQLDWFDSIGGALIDWYVAEGEHPEGQLAADGFRLFPTSDLYPSGALPCTRDCERCALPTPRCDFAASRCVACLDDRDCAHGTRCERGECAVPTLPDAGYLGDAGLDAGADASLDAGLAPLSPEGGCGCAVGDTGPARRAPLAAMLVLALCRGLRRRERTIAAMNAVDARAMSIPRELDKEFLAEVIDHIAHPIFVKDREFRFVLLNRAMEGMLGISRAEMLGHTDYDFFPKEQADWFREKDVEMFTLGQRVEITEEPITDKGGHQHTLATSKVPLRDASGVITHLVGIIHDITPLKRAEEALREVTSALELRMQERTNDLLEAQTELVRRERLAVIGLFAGTLAHQIRNPLGSIKNAAYLVQLAVPTMDDDLRRALSIIQDEVARANQIITDLVDYARVSSAQRRVVPVDLLMEIALSGMDLPTNVAIHIECPALPKVFVDPAQLQRALQKLVKNALQSMSNGGTLTLSARTEGDAVFFAVTDTGKGIPDDVRSRLFEPLVSGNPGSLGLGLITARALVENQGGALALEKSNREGTRVVLRLPVAPPAEH